MKLTTLLAAAAAVALVLAAPVVAEAECDNTESVSECLLKNAPNMAHVAADFDNDEKCKTMHVAKSETEC